MKRICNKSSKDRTSLRALARLAVLFGLAMYSIVSGTHGLAILLQTRNQVNAVENINLKLIREIALKKNHVQRLQSDPATQVLELERAGFTYPGATVFKIGPRKLQPIATTPPDLDK